MPSLKDLTCTIELSHAHQPLPEYNTLYGDGIVETCVPIPTQPQSFSIHLTSTKFIAPGIALFVYIDGVYQCNRNRQGLKPGMLPDRRSLVDFRVRQKEERKRDGSMVARKWTFDTSSTLSTDEPRTENTLENKDCIEVVVLRCAGTRDTKTVPPMNLDGAGDWSDCHLDSDAGSSRDRKWYGYDDRGPECDRIGGGFESGPPPSSSYRAPYAETLHSGEGSDYKIHYRRDRASTVPTARHLRHKSRYSGAISLHTRRADDLPPEGFQYGSGPIPSEKEGPHRRKHSNTGLETNGVDPVWLNKLLKTPVKQGVEESRRAEVRSEKHDRDSTHVSQKEDLTSQAPEAWPGSPISEHKGKFSNSKRVSSRKSDHRSDGGSDWGQSQIRWTQDETKSKAGTHVNWNVEPVWETETSSGDNDWHSNGETPSESWDTDETWETATAKEWKDLSISAKLCPSTAPPHLDSQHLVRPGLSKACCGTHLEDKRWANHTPSSSSISLSSSNDTIQPLHDQGHVQTPRRRSKASTHPSKSPDSHTQNPSRPMHHTASKASAPSSITHVTPVIVNIPAILDSKHPRPKKSSTHADTRVTPLPVPAWVAAVQDTMSMRRSDTLPAPFDEGWDGAEKDTGATWGQKGKDTASTWYESRGNTASAWDASRKNNPSVNEKKPRSTASSTWGTLGKQHGRPENTPPAPYAEAWDEKGKSTVATWDEVRKDTALACDRDKKHTPSSWDESDKNSTTTSEKKLRSTSSSTWGSTKRSTWGAATTWSSTPKLSHKTEWITEPSSVVPWATTTPSAKKPRSKKDRKASQVVKSSSVEKINAPKSSPTQPKQDTSKKVPVAPFTTNWFFPSPPHSRASHASSTKKPTVENSHQPTTTTAIRTTEAIDYGHAVARPEYLDSLDRPYAVFRFRCRRGEVTV